MMGKPFPTASSEFHVYELDWNADRMVFSVDGVTHYTYNPTVKDASTWPFDAPQYFLLNVAIQPSISSSFTQSAMDIDYVRVYEATPTDSNGGGGSGSNPAENVYDDFEGNGNDYHLGRRWIDHGYKFCKSLCRRNQYLGKRF